MKKFIFTILFSMLFGFGLVSCMNHEFDPSAQVSQIYAKYENAFVTTFGKPAPNQTWGFSSVSGTRATDGFEFPGDADASKFLTEVPTGVEGYDKINSGNGYASGMSSFIDESIVGKIKEVNIWAGGAGTVLYVSGNCDFSNKKFYLGPNSELYLVKGATLTISAGDATNFQGGSNVYIAEGAKIVTTGELKANKGMHIYNHGTLEANILSVNENSVVYNVGTLKVTDKLSVDNGESVIVNDGDITANEFNTAGSGKFQNNGDMTVKDATTVNSNSNAWINNGFYHTGSFTYNAASDEVINNCKMIVDGDFNMNLGDNPGDGNFKMNAGSSVVTKNFNGGRYKAWYAPWYNYREFTGGPFYVYMGAGSLFRVTDTATMDATKANYGIYGPETGGYAVFHATKIVAGNPGQGYEVTYGGNLAVVTESHFAQGYSGTYPYIDIKGNAKIYENGDMPEISIPESTCNPGFGKVTEVTPEPETPTEPEFTFLCRVFAEDLTASQGSDFDFNDVVFDVYTNGTDAKVQLLAAGGTLPLTVWDVEVHEQFGVDTKIMVNTGQQAHVNDLDCEPFYVPGVHTLEQVRDVITICVYQNEIPCILTADMGKAPAKFAVTEKIDWVEERSDIRGTYPNFTEWVKTTTPATWWK